MHDAIAADAADDRHDYSLLYYDYKEDNGIFGDDGAGDVDGDDLSSLNS